ncbi:MAG: hypothetical protein V4714_06935 [Bacteroidota bacterium]
MKLIQQASLWFSEGNSDKIYEVDLCEVGSNQYVVNFRYGRRGATLRDGTKTALPVAEDQARKIYDLLVGSKVKEGYQAVGSGMAPAANPPATPADNPAVQSDKAAYLLGLLQKAISTGSLPSKVKWPLSRIIWRAGELRLPQSVPSLLALLPKSDDLQQYCLAWALGRCGDEAAIPTLERLHIATASSNKVKRIALISWLALAKGEARKVVVSRVLNQLPADLRAVVVAVNEDSLRTFLAEHFEKTIAFEVFETLYLLAEDFPHVYGLVNEYLQQVPLRAAKASIPSTFRAFRHIFKIAEFREDEQVFGVVARRLEKTPQLFNLSNWGDYAYVNGHSYDNTKRELAKKDSRLAYSNKTRTYLRRRLWRTLRTLGNDGEAAYVKMAVGALLAFSDKEDYTAPKQIRLEQYDWRQRVVNVRITHYDAYANAFLFNHILYQNSPRYEYKVNTRAWRCKAGYEPGQPAPAEREEAFPALWDQHPEGLLVLLVNSEVERVHDFAVKALRANPRLSKLLTADWAIQLISMPYAVTVRLGLEWLRQFYNPVTQGVAVVGTLISHPLPEARVLAREWMDANGALYIQHPSVVAQIIINPHEDVWEWSHNWLAKHRPELYDSRAIIMQVIATLLALPNDETMAAATNAAARTLLEYLSEPLRTIGFEVIQDLLQHPLSGVQLLGAGILLRHQIPAEDLPASIFELLIRASSPDVRQAGVQLFGKLPVERLLASQEVLLAFCVSAHPEVRLAVRPIIRQLVTQNPDFGQQLMHQMVAIIQSHEPFDGLHNDVFELISQELTAFLPQIKLDTSLSLLHSRRAVNQKLGNLLLEKVIPNAKLSIRQVVKLAAHEMLEVRQRARQFYETNLDRLRAEPAEALRILDVSWEDSRRFAFDFLRQHFSESDWTPSLLVSVCDSTREDVRQFGRELITRFFKEDHGTDYLLKLSQHPSQDLQLFATNYLQQFASGKTANIQSLESYFTTVLSQVNRAGIAKKRIFAFLKNEALQHEEVALLVAKLMTRQSATMAVADKAACLQVMVQLKKAFPHLDMPLSLKPVAAYNKMNYEL